jgi:hypothetical protein
LCLVDTFDLVHTLQFDDEFIFHEYIKSVATVQSDWTSMAQPITRLDRSSNSVSSCSSCSSWSSIHANVWHLRQLLVATDRTSADRLHSSLQPGSVTRLLGTLGVIGNVSRPPRLTAVVLQPEALCKYQTEKGDESNLFIIGLIPFSAFVCSNYYSPPGIRRLRGKTIDEHLPSRLATRILL